MCHLVRVVVEADDCFALFDTRQQQHQCSVCHDEVEVVPREVKIYSLWERNWVSFPIFDMLTYTALILMQDHFYSN